MLVQSTVFGISKAAIALLLAVKNDAPFARSSHAGRSEEDNKTTVMSIKSRAPENYSLADLQFRDLPNCGPAHNIHATPGTGRRSVNMDVLRAFTVAVADAPDINREKRPWTFDVAGAAIGK